MTRSNRALVTLPQEMETVFLDELADDLDFEDDEYDYDHWDHWDRYDDDYSFNEPDHDEADWGMMCDLDYNY